MNKSFTKILLLLLILLVAITGVYFYTSYSQPQTSPFLPPVPTKIPTVLEIKRKDVGIAKVGVPLSLEIVADSAGQDVVGYDVLVGYDDNDFIFQSMQSSTPKYQIFKNKTEASYLSLTAVKSPEVKEVIPFSKQTLFTLTFRPLKAGSYSFSILPSFGRETTKLVNDRVKISLPQVEKLAVDVQD